MDSNTSIILIGGGNGSVLLEPSSATPSRAVFVSLSVIMGITTFASLLLNGLVVVASLRHKELRQPLNTSLLSLAAADLGMALAGGLPNTVTNAVGGLVMGRAGCITEGFLMSFFGIAALDSVCVLSVERYVVVCRPLGSLRFTPRHAALGLAVAWLWALAWTVPPLMGWGRYGPEGVGTSCAPDWADESAAGRAYILCFLVFCFALQLLIIIFCYGRLMMTLHQAPKLSGGASQRAERQVGIMVVLMVLAFLVSWTPYAVCSIAVAVTPGLKLSPLLATVPLYAAKSSTAYNPVIYIILNRNFRSILRQMICGKAAGETRAESEAVTRVETLRGPEEGGDKGGRSDEAAPQATSSV
uniref:Parapinopsin n=1 Tax=Geotria australis TaxID=71168 RepID=A0A1B1SKC6_9VERT|nr:parapinopsin [Geotria australis]